MRHLGKHEKGISRLEVALFGYYLLGNGLTYMIDEIITCFISIFFELFEVQLSLRLKKSKANPQTSFKPPTNSHPLSTAINAVESSVSSGVHT